MRYCWTTIMVGSLDESIAFYRDVVGLPVVRRFDAGPTGEIAFLGDGETQVELIQGRSGTAVVGDAITLGFAVDSLDTTMAFLASRQIPIESGPFQPNDHIRFCYVLDPNRVRVQFSESR